jgi:hypothetical protein
MARIDQHLIATSSHTAGAYYLIGVGGDDDPERALRCATFVNDGSTKLCVALSLTGARGSRKLPVMPGASIPIEGPVEHLVVHNPHASTAGSWGLWAETELRNSGQDGGVLPALDTAAADTRYLPARATFTAGATADKTIRFGRRETLSSLKVEALAAFSGGTIEFDLLDDAGNRLITAKLDLETLVAKTLTTVTLTATTSLLTIPAGKSVTLRVSSSSGGDTGGPLAVELGLAA